MPPQMPNATPRRPAGTAADRTVSVSGMTIAPPTPWAARATSRARIDGASAARGGRHREDRDADRQQPPAPEPVAQGGTGQQQHRERQRVGIDGPLKTAQARVQVLADHRDRGRHDEVVERDHEHRNRGDRQRPPCLGRHSLPDRGRVWHDAVGQRTHGVTPKLAMKLPLDSQRMHRCGGALVHGTHSSQDNMAAPTAPSSRSPEGHQRRCCKRERRSRRGGNDPIGVIQKRRALILLLRLSLLPSAAPLRS